MTVFVCVGLSVLVAVAGSCRPRTRPWSQSVLCNSRVPTVFVIVVAVGGLVVVPCVPVL